MQVLLDTHVLIWAFDGNPDLSRNARIIIEDNSIRKYVSLVSFWEIGLKVGLGKLKMKQELLTIYRQVSDWQTIILPITIESILRVRDLPYHHRDPFDRMLIAQAQQRGLTLISCDTQFDKFDVPILW